MVRMVCMAGNASRQKKPYLPFAKLIQRDCKCVMCVHSLMQTSQYLPSAVLWQPACQTRLAWRMPGRRQALPGQA